MYDHNEQHTFVWLSATNSEKGHNIVCILALTRLGHTVGGLIQNHDNQSNVNDKYRDQITTPPGWRFHPGITPNPCIELISIVTTWVLTSLRHSTTAFSRVTMDIGRKETCSSQVSDGIPMPLYSRTHYPQMWVGVLMDLQGPITYHSVLRAPLVYTSFSLLGIQLSTTK